MHGKLVENQTTKFNCSNPELLKVTISSERDTDTERCAGQEGKGGGRERQYLLEWALPRKESSTCGESSFRH
jgi:hypothetical protein